MHRFDPPFGTAGAAVVSALKRLFAMASLARVRGGKFMASGSPISTRQRTGAVNGKLRNRGTGKARATRGSSLTES
jgi:hypothetical protein